MKHSQWVFQTQPRLLPPGLPRLHEDNTGNIKVRAVEEEGRGIRFLETSEIIYYLIIHIIVG